jgi:hypothetical protein
VEIDKGGTVSKLLDKLNQVSRNSAPAIGFRAAAATPKSPRMLLIAALHKVDASAIAAAKESADAILLREMESTTLLQKSEKLATSSGELPWGVTIGETTEEHLAKLKAAGCDFLTFDAEKAPLILLREGEMGRILKLGPSLPDGLTRATAQLPIDAVLIGDDTSLTVQRLMICQHLANLVHKPLLMTTPTGIPGEDLKELWETGLVGVVVEMAGDAKGGLSGLRNAIDALPLSRRRRREKAEVMLPYLGGEATTDVDEEEEE